MFKKILLPLDLTSKHQAAFELAMNLARQSDAEIILLHVIEVMSGLSLDEERDFYNRLEAAARQHLSEYGNTLAGERIAWHLKVILGNRAMEVARFAVESAVDLIVLTVPPLAPDKPLGLGSLGYKVSVLAPCPVLLVK